MKRLLLIALLFCSSYQGFSNSLIGLWAGAGLATRYNYDYGVTFGAEYTKAVFYRVGFGLSAFAQQYNLYYDKDNALSNAASIRNNSNFVFACPKIECHLGKKGNIHVYLSAGAGFKMGATDTLRKWQRVSHPGSVVYDSSVDRSASMNSMIYRVGVGCQEHLRMSDHWSFTFAQDFGFLPSLISSSDDPTNAKLNNNVNRLYKPTYITLRIGICRNSH